MTLKNGDLWDPHCDQLPQTNNDQTKFVKCCLKTNGIIKNTFTTILCTLF